MNFSLTKKIQFGGDDETGPIDDYLELLEAQGEYAPAFDFFTVSNLWMLISTALVFIMQLGFAMLEAGLVRQKNVVNVLFKNIFIISVSIISYALLGFNTNYPGDFNGLFSIGPPIGDFNAEGSNTWEYGGLGLAMTGYTDFIFQAMFASTAATIVSGAVAERVKLGSFMIYITLLAAVAFPVVSSWHWGGGWLSELDFKDFAGSSVVHAFGGSAALACVLLLGPRSGKYDLQMNELVINPIEGHSMPLATIGAFLIFFGWFGFNGGNVLSAEPSQLGLVITNTVLAACSSTLASIFMSFFYAEKLNLLSAIDGMRAGLVAISASADTISSPSSAMLLGFITGVIVIPSIRFFDEKIKIDDPVGAISVHGVCGIWGTIAAGIFGGHDLGNQIKGALSVSSAAAVFSYIVFGLLKQSMGIRVSEEEEVKGLDIAFHGQTAYNYS